MSAVTLLQWNVWYQEKASHIAELLGQINPDIFCCQEITADSPDNPRIDVPRLIAEKFKYEYYFVPTMIKGTDEYTRSMGNAIFSRFPIIEKRNVLIQKAPQGNFTNETENRAYVEIVLDINGVLLKIGTVHLSYAHAFEPTEKKLLEADNLFKAVAENKKLFILTGDMNAKPESSIIQQLTTMLKSAGPAFDQPTWTTKPFSYNGFEANTLDWRLDYVFHTPDINTISAEIVTTDFSDHLPILTKFELLTST